MPTLAEFSKSLLAVSRGDVAALSKATTAFARAMSQVAPVKYGRPVVTIKPRFILPKKKQAS